MLRHHRFRDFYEKYGFLGIVLGIFLVAFARTPGRA